MLTESSTRTQSNENTQLELDHQVVYQTGPEGAAFVQQLLDGVIKKSEDTVAVESTVKGKIGLMLEKLKPIIHIDLDRNKDISSGKGGEFAELQAKLNSFDENENLPIYVRKTALLDEDFIMEMTKNKKASEITIEVLGNFQETAEVQRLLMMNLLRLIEAGYSIYMENQSEKNTEEDKMDELYEDTLKLLGQRKMPIFKFGANDRIFIDSFEVLSTTEKGGDLVSRLEKLDDQGGSPALALRQFKDYCLARDQTINLDKISINMGKDTLLNTKVIDEIVKNNTYARYILVEVLEESHGTTSEQEQIIQNLKALNKAGYDISMDDFGAESSNEERVASFLKNGILQNLKLDKIEVGIVWTLHKERNDSKEKRHMYDEKKAYYKSLIKGGVSLTAEWMDSFEIIDVVKKMGVSKFQGYFLEGEYRTQKKAAGTSNVPHVSYVI